MTKSPAAKTAKKTAAAKTTKKSASKAKGASNAATALLDEALNNLGLINPQLREQYPAIAEMEKNLAAYEKAGLTVGRCFRPAQTHGEYAGFVYVTKDVDGMHVIVGGIHLYSTGARPNVYHPNVHQAMYSCHSNGRTTIDDIASLKDDRDWHVDDYAIPYSSKPSASQKMQKVASKILQAVSDYGLNVTDFIMTGSDTQPLSNMVFEPVGNTYRLIADLRVVDSYLQGKIYGTGELNHNIFIGSGRDIPDIKACVARMLQVAGKTLDDELKAEISEKIGGNPDPETYVWTNPITRTWYANTRKTYLYDDAVEWSGPNNLGSGDEPNTDGLTNIKYALPPKEAIAHKTVSADIISDMLKDYIAQFEDRTAKYRPDATGQRMVTDIVLDLERGRRMLKTAEDINPHDLVDMDMHPMMRGPGFMRMMDMDMRRRFPRHDRDERDYHG